MYRLILLFVLAFLLLFGLRFGDGCALGLFRCGSWLLFFGGGLNFLLWIDVGGLKACPDAGASLVTAFFLELEDRCLSAFRLCGPIIIGVALAYERCAKLAIRGTIAPSLLFGRFSRSGYLVLARVFGLLASCVHRCL